MSSFSSTADRHLRGDVVRVVSNDGQTFEGWLESIDLSDRHVILRDASLVAGEGVRLERGTVFVAHADSIEELKTESSIERVALENVHTSPYHVAEYELEDHRLFVDEVRREGWAESFPTVRPLRDEDGRVGAWEVLEGHKRLWAAAEAGLPTHPVEIVEVDDVEAARAFVYDHLPAERHLQDDESKRHDNWYGDDEVEAAIRALVDEIGEAALEFDRVAFNNMRLGAYVEGPVRGDES